MTRFLALYGGPTISSAELLAVSADQRLVQDFGRRLVSEEPDEPEMKDHGRRPKQNDSYRRLKKEDAQ